MSIHLDEVLDYLDDQQVCRKAENMESLMEMIHEGYTRYYKTDKETIYTLFRQLRSIWEPCSPMQEDRMFSLICDLCRELELQSFSQGVCAGMLLMTEVNRVK